MPNSRVNTISLKTVWYTIYLRIGLDNNLKLDVHIFKMLLHILKCIIHVKVISMMFRE